MRLPCQEKLLLLPRKVSLVIFAMMLTITSQAIAFSDVHPPKKCMDGSGNAVVVWIQKDVESFSLKLASLLAGGEWSSPVTVASTSRFLSEPFLAVNAGGDAVIMWSAIDVNNVGNLCVATLPFGGSLSTPTVLSNSGFFFFSENPLTMDNSGNIVIVWSLYSSYTECCIYSATASFGGSWNLRAVCN